MNKYSHIIRITKESAISLRLLVLNGDGEEVAEGCITPSNNGLTPWETSYVIKHNCVRERRRFFSARRALKALYAEISYTFHISEVQAPAQVFKDLL